MNEDRFPREMLDDDEDDGTMPENVTTLSDAVIGHRIVSAEKRELAESGIWRTRGPALVITLDDGTAVALADTDDCCAFTELESFFRDPTSVDHVIIGVGTTEKYTTWHIYADFGDVMRLKVGWSCGNPFYYGYGFDIHVSPSGSEL